MTDGPGPHPLTKIPGSAHVLIQILGYRVSSMLKCHIIIITWDFSGKALRL